MNNSDSRDSSPVATASVNFKVIGLVDHEAIDSDTLIMVEAALSKIIHNNECDDEAAQADHSHSTLSTPDKVASSSVGQALKGNSPDSKEIANVDKVKIKEKIPKVRTSRSQRRAMRAKNESQEQTQEENKVASASIIKEEAASPDVPKKVKKEARVNSQPKLDRPDFVYADFFFGFKQQGMRKKISLAISKLRQGSIVTIKAFDNYVERAIQMCEILKMRIFPLFKETHIIKQSKKKGSANQL